MRVLAILYNNQEGRPLRVSEITARLGGGPEVYDAAKKACQRLLDRRLLERRGGGYCVADKQLARLCLERGTVRTDYVDATRASVPAIQRVAGLLDLTNAIVEHGLLWVRIDARQCSLVRTFLGKQIPAPGDRSGKLAYTGRAFTLVVTTGGMLAVTVKNPAFQEEMFKFLRGCGLSEGDCGSVLLKLGEKAAQMQVSVEIPILASKREVPKTFDVETRVGTDVIRSRINFSSGQADLEIRGKVLPVFDLLAHLAGSQHNAAVEWVQADRLSEISSTASSIAEGLRRIAEAIEPSQGKSVQPQKTDREPTYIQ